MPAPRSTRSTIAALGIGVSIAVAAMLAGEVRPSAAHSRGAGPDRPAGYPGRQAAPEHADDRTRLRASDGSGPLAGAARTTGGSGRHGLLARRQPLRFENPHSVVRHLQRADRREHVDDRLRGQTGNRSRADVLNRAGQPRTKHGCHPAPAVRRTCPATPVVLDDLHDLIGAST